VAGQRATSDDRSAVGAVPSGGMLTPVKGGSAKPCSDKDKDNNKRLARCGKCTNCKSQDCGACYNCADKPKFGGPGIKKQACVNRKCLLMVPRDEDGEKLARKRAKQRAVPPHMPHMTPITTGDNASFLSALAVELPSSPVPTRSSVTTLPSPRSGMSTPTSPLEGCPLGRILGDRCGPTSAARTQALSEESLFALALDEERGRSLSSAMLFATIQTPVGSPQRVGSERSVGGGSSASPSPVPSPTSMRCKRPVEIDLEDMEDDKELNAAFVAHIAAKLELDAPPPAQPPLDELHEEVLLLNAEHRRATECVLAF